MKKSVAIIGGGPSALILAAFLDPRSFSVTIYERNKSMARKFLVAGKGGFNLTHSEAIGVFAERYTPASFLRPALKQFSNEDLREWLAAIGIPTFVGSSRRVYPEEGIKPIEVLNQILAVLKKKGVKLEFEQYWEGWDKEGSLQFASGLKVRADYTVFALGGSSWKVTGSDGQWLTRFAEQGIKVLPFKAANCAYQIQWPKAFIEQYEGQPLKNICIRCGERVQKGEVVITRFGLEGNAIYALSPQIQQQLDQQQSAQLYLDLKPSLEVYEIAQRLSKSKEKNRTTALRKQLKLSAAQTQLLKSFSNKATFLDPQQLAHLIKRVPLSTTAAAPIDQAISTTGGIVLEEVNAQFELLKLPQNYCIGEMLDWNAPTGGYLLQACFSMGVWLARNLNQAIPFREG